MSVSHESKTNHVYVIILNWNGWKDTIECLDSVLKSSAVKFSVIVCDNDLTDSNLQIIKMLRPIQQSLVIRNTYQTQKGKTCWFENRQKILKDLHDFLTYSSVLYKHTFD